MTLIEEIRSLVEEACRQKTNVFGHEIWTHHILEVVRYGKELARRREADEEIVEIAALFHDYAKIKDIHTAEVHHILSAQEAERFLVALGYPPKRIEKVKESILSHRGSVPAKQRNLEAQCLADADALSHFDSIPGLFRYLYAVEGKSIDEAVEWLWAKLERSWNKLSPDAKELARTKYEACRLLLGQEHHLEPARKATPLGR